MKKALYHLPGLFEHFDFYQVFIPFYEEHKNYFYDDVEIGSVYGAPSDCLWNGGRVSSASHDFDEVFSFYSKHNLSARLTLSNSLLKEEHLKDKRCNELCSVFSQSKRNGVILSSDLLLEYLKKNYPNFYFVSSTTKVLTNFDDLKKELERDDFEYVVPDFRLNHDPRLNDLEEKLKNKIEFLCNEDCSFHCKDRKQCYENVSRINLGEEVKYECTSSDKEGYRFYKAMKNPGFISKEEIQDFYLENGFFNFKIEGRGLGSGLLFEFILYYMVKPEYQLEVREKIYLENTLDLF